MFSMDASRTIEYLRAAAASLENGDSTTAIECTEIALHGIMTHMTQQAILPGTPLLYATADGHQKAHDEATGTVS